MKDVTVHEDEKMGSISGSVSFIALTSILRIMTELPFVYKKFFPLGSPPRTIGWPRVVRGRVA